MVLDRADRHDAGRPGERRSVHHNPDLLAGLSDALKRRMQGKSCFNFKAVDKDLFQELARLTQKSVARVKQDKLF